MTEAEAWALLRHGCEGKAPYGANTAQQQAAKWNAVNAIRDADAKPVRKYVCMVCGAWHVGHVPDMQGVAAIAEALRVVQGCAPGAPSNTVSRRERKRQRKVHA